MTLSTSGTSPSDKIFRCDTEECISYSFGNDWARLTKDLLFDSEGALKFKPELWMDIRKVILPTIIDRVRIGAYIHSSVY